MAAEEDTSTESPCKDPTSREDWAALLTRMSRKGRPSVTNDNESRSTEPAPSAGDPSTPEAASQEAWAGAIASDWAEYRRQASELVPDIGKGRRWYDHAYKIASWIQGSMPRRFLPRQVRLWLSYLTISLHAFNSRDQYKVWPRADLSRRLNVPTDEHVAFPCIWVVDLFPPSRYEALLKASKRKGWTGSSRIQHAQSHEILAASRGGRGWSWWNMAEITDPRARYSFGSDTVQELPPEFTSVEVRGITVGPSLTAVVGCFTLDENVSKGLDDLWHADHEPTVIRRGPMLQPEDRQWAGFRQTQQKRQSIHDAARAWMSKNLPGFFATSHEPQLLLDLCLTDRYDPTAVHQDRDENDAFRALGLIHFDAAYHVSPHIPGLILLPADGVLCANLEARNVWTLWGQSGVVKDAFGDSLAGRGGNLGRAFASALDHRIRMFAVALSFTGYVEAAKAQHAELRDTATGQHRRFSATKLRKLRHALLNLSIDLSGVERDTRAFWEKRSFSDPIAHFDHVEAPAYVAWLRENGETAREPVDFNKRIRKRQRSELRALIESDDTYRDILSTVSSLGASADSTRVGRLALLLAAASFVIAGVSLWGTIEDDAPTQGTNQPDVGQTK